MYIVVWFLDPCLGSPCQNEGTCMHSSSGDSFTCSCHPAYTGPTCGIPTNPCALERCENGATCTNINETAYSCECATDFTGTNCDVTIDHCADPSINCNNGTCADNVGFYTCECDAGYMGEACNTDIDECATANCVNGDCINLVATHQCVCFDGWTGASCETDIDYCATDDPNDLFGPCDDRGSSGCVDGNSTFSCICVIGFTNFDCSVDIDECESEPCLNGGTCVNLFFTILDCQCPTGYQGSICEIVLFPCTLTPCSNGGTCVDQGEGDFICQCPQGFTGETCDTDFCTPTTCENGPPVSLAITTPPANTSVPESTSAQLHCVVTSTSVPIIQWWFTPHGSLQPQLVANQLGTMLPGYSVQSSATSSLTLIVQNVQFHQNHGKYTCRASVGNLVESASANLNVLCKC